MGGGCPPWATRVSLSLSAGGQRCWRGWSWFREHVPETAQDLRWTPPGRWAGTGKELPPPVLTAQALQPPGRGQTRARTRNVAWAAIPFLARGAQKPRTPQSPPAPTTERFLAKVRQSRGTLDARPSLKVTGNGSSSNVKGCGAVVPLSAPQLPPDRRPLPSTTTPSHQEFPAGGWFQARVCVYLRTGPVLPAAAPAPDPLPCPRALPRRH